MNPELVSWKDMTDKHLTSLINKKEDPNKYNQKWKKSNKWHHWFIKDYKKILQPTICKLENLEEMNKFLETRNFPGLNQEETENLNRLITTTKLKQ